MSVRKGWLSLQPRFGAFPDEDGLRIRNPDALLDAWAAADDWEKRMETREYSLLRGEGTGSPSIIKPSIWHSIASMAFESASSVIVPAEKQPGISGTATP